MLAEVLADRGDWSQVMPGVRACLFSLEKSPLPLPLRLEPLHFEALFCVAGTVTLTRRDGSALTAGARQVLLLTDASSLSAVMIFLEFRQAFHYFYVRISRKFFSGCSPM